VISRINEIDMVYALPALGHSPTVIRSNQRGRPDCVRGIAVPIDINCVRASACFEVVARTRIGARL
jgi:hypothetical protein